MKFYGIEMDGPMLLETLAVLPEFNPDSDKGRLVYINTIIGGALYYGSETQWERLLINDDIGTAIEEIDDHINDFNNPHNVTTTQIGATPLTTFNAHVANQNDPHNTIGLIQTQLVPPGAVFHFARNTAPNGYLVCNGAIVSRTTYANLFAAIGTTFGAGNGTTTFGLPNLLGEFIRGWDGGRGIDSGRTFGSFQSDEFKSHSHSIRFFRRNIDGDGAEGDGSLAYWVGLSNGYIDNAGGLETRPRNIALLPCIKF